MMYLILLKVGFEKNSDWYELLLLLLLLSSIKKNVLISTQYFLTSVLVQLTRTPSVVTGYNYPERKGTHVKKIKRK